MGEKRNHFLNSKRAEIYARARPSFHAQTLERYLDKKHNRILDVACGS